MKKKILLMIIALVLMIPVCTKAADNVEIKDIKLIEKSNTTTELSAATVNGLKLKFNLSFTNQGDNAEYQFTLKNNSNKDYEVETGTTFSDDKVMKYEFVVAGDSKVLKAGESKMMFVTITYNELPDPSKFVDGKYIEDNEMTINLSNNGTIVNPKTFNNKIILGIILMLVIATLIVIAYSQKKGILVLVLLLIPFSVLALEKITIQVDAHVEIIQSETTPVTPAETKELEYYDCYSQDPLVIEYEVGMTFSQLLSSDYVSELSSEAIASITSDLNDGVEFYYKDNTTQSESVTMSSVIKDSTLGAYFGPCQIMSPNTVG